MSWFAEYLFVDDGALLSSTRSGAETAVCVCLPAIQ